MFPGLSTLCLATKNLEDMKRYYETLGFVVHRERPGMVILNNGDLDLALATILDEHCLNFRGADPFVIHQTMTNQGLKVSGTPAHYKKEQYQADADGSNWITPDTDGNQVFFDTNENEIGEQGKALALQRVLDSINKQLTNIGAPKTCQEAFADKILNRFIPKEKRISEVNGLDTSPLPQAGKFAGNFTLCLKTTDNQVSHQFYEPLGFKVTNKPEDPWIQLDNGDCQISLMSFLKENWLNFRGADPFRIHSDLKTLNIPLEGEPSRYTEEEYGLPGAHWETRDPDGNVVYFDTSDPEIIKSGDPATLTSVLNRGLTQLQNIEADDTCITAFETEMITKFA